MFLGYSASSATQYPSIRYTGRLATEPLNQLEAERTIITSTSAQIPNPNAANPRNRWGDYASVVVDPVDGCTFWFATEYLVNNGLQYQNWRTRISNFKFPGCTP